MTSPARQNEAVQFPNGLDQRGGIRKLGQYMQLSFAMVRYETVRVFRTRDHLSGGSAVSIHVGYYSSTTRQGVQFGLLVAADAEKSYLKDLVSEKKACLSSKHEFPSIRDLVKSHPPIPRWRVRQKR